MLICSKALSFRNGRKPAAQINATGSCRIVARSELPAVYASGM
jgi:hypothetical protein